MTGLLSRCWLVVDMDGTLISTPSKHGGRYVSLAESAVETPLSRWLLHGGNVCVISTAGARLFRQVHQTLKPVLARHLTSPVAAATAAATAAAAATAPRTARDPARFVPSASRSGRLLLSGMGGASLFASTETGDMALEKDYVKHANKGQATAIDARHVPEVAARCHQILKSFLRVAAHDPSLLSSLSAKYHAPYAKMLAQMKAMGQERYLREVFTLEAVKAHGRFMEDAPLLTVYGERGPQSGRTPTTTATASSDAVVQYGIMGIPQARFDQFIPESTTMELYARCGVAIRRQPNSVVLANAGVDKATCISWLIKHSRRYDDFSLTRAVAVGDFPKTVDYPMTLFPPMPFISVALKPTDSMGLPNVTHVGGEEDGAATFLHGLVAAVERDGAAAALHPSSFALIARAASASQQVREHTSGRADHAAQERYHVPGYMRARRRSAPNDGDTDFRLHKSKAH